MTTAIELHWFRLAPADPPDGLLTLLSEAERRRSERLRVDQPRRVFESARIALRLLLARELDEAPEHLRFSEGPHGKPALVPPAPVGFNQSHSGDTVVIAIARDLELGVDVEELRSGVRTAALALRFFDPSESQVVEAQPEGPGRARTFFHFWTAKEAVLKATGSGLTVPVRSVVISTDPDEAPHVLRFRQDRREAENWCLWRIEEPDHFVCTVAARGAADRHLRVHRFSFPQANPASPSSPGTNERPAGTPDELAARRWPGRRD